MDNPFPGLIRAFQSLFQPKQPPQPVSNGKMIGNPQDLKLTVDTSPIQRASGALPPSQPTVSAPTQAPMSGDSQGFKFEMGRSQYPQAHHQLQQLFGDAPLSQYTDDFVRAGEKYQVDPRVLAMVGQIESSGGRNYPADSNNPFGYLVDPTTGHGVEDVYTGLRNAGFTSVPMAIDRLTRRFSSQYGGSHSAYPQFDQNPTIDQLQQSYNANPNERDNYLRVAAELLKKMQ